MGFLDHSTNNIIVDAVLTDKGRAVLADPISAFSVAYFALGDDEIDYGIIKQFGRTVGKEKIEKNTPVLEAFTQNNLAQKSKLYSINNETLTHLPLMTLDVTNNMVTLKRSSRNNATSVAITIKNTQSDLQIPFQVADTSVDVDVDTRFLLLLGAGSPISNTKNNISTYNLKTSRESGSSIKSTLNFNLKSIVEKDFSKYSIPAGTYIRSFIKITGTKSGVQKIIEVRIH
jgi:hypothetical protein